MRIVTLASGSEGNATLFEAGGTRVLVDAGVGPGALSAALGGPPSHVGPAVLPHAVVITHAHQDHFGRARAYAKRLRIPVYVTESTARAHGVTIGAESRFRLYGAREPFSIGALTFEPTPVPHDAAQVALVVTDGTQRAGLVTDAGEVTASLCEHLAGCHVLLVESNHDPELLAAGPYPEFLKRRVTSARGHLSNAQAHELLRGAAASAHAVVLMHLSRTNNRADLALDVARDALAPGTDLFVAPARAPLAVSAIPPGPFAARGVSGAPRVPEVRGARGWMEPASVSAWRVRAERVSARRKDRVLPGQLSLW